MRSIMALGGKTLRYFEESKKEVKTKTAIDNWERVVGIVK